MSDLTRRRFLTKTSLGVGLAVTGLAAAAQLEGALPPLGAGARRAVAGQLPHNTVLHVRDLSTGEFMLLAGTREIVFRDLDLASQLVAAVNRAAATGGRRI